MMVSIRPIDIDLARIEICTALNRLHVDFSENARDGHAISRSLALTCCDNPGDIAEVCRGWVGFLESILAKSMNGAEYEAARVVINRARELHSISLVAGSHPIEARRRAERLPAKVYKNRQVA